MLPSCLTYGEEKEKCTMKTRKANTGCNDDADTGGCELGGPGAKGSQRILVNIKQEWKGTKYCWETYLGVERAHSSQLVRI
jgi:hypothetical protein